MASCASQTDRHVRGRLARSLMMLGAVAATSTLLACGGDTTPNRDDEAPAADVAAEQAAQGPKATPTPKAADDSVATKGADGKTYRCPATAMGPIDTAKDRVTRRDKILKGRRAAVRKIEKKYPGGTAPAAVVTRYKKLFARVNAQVKHTNRAIRQYNALLKSECAPD